MTGLCYRCEYRARFLETAEQPRYECGRKEQSVHSCYMYKPVKPLTLARNTGDRREITAGWVMSARAHTAKDQVRMKLMGKRFNRKILQWWEPDNVVR